MSGKYPDAFYRVSLKAIICNDAGEVLVVKENGSQWTLPGGGMDHGESIHDALTRELYEEILLTAPFRETLIDSATMYLAKKEAWLLWMVFIVEIDDFTYGLGQDADEVAFIHPTSFKDSVFESEQLIYALAAKHLTTRPAPRHAAGIQK
jgi:8-oxo-dGTP pyrophosphatase MutT (NUDIX family)